MLLAEALGKALDLQHLVALELPALEAGLQFTGLGGLLGGTHPLDALFHGKRTLVQGVVAHKGPQVHLLGGLLQLLDLGLLLQILLHPLLIAAFLFNGVKAVIAAVKLRLTVLYLDDAGDSAVQKVAVVTDGDHRAAKFAEVFLQPLCGLQIQMVRRLVQQQDVRVLQDQAA